MTAVAHSFGEAETPEWKIQTRKKAAEKQDGGSLAKNSERELAKNISEDDELSAKKLSTLPRDVALSSLNLVRDIHLDLLNVESLSALVSVRASLKIYIGLDQVKDYSKCLRTRHTCVDFGHFKAEITICLKSGQSCAHDWV